MIGSREWMNLSNGNLSFKEKAQLIKTVLLPALTGYGKTLAFKYNVCRPPAYHLKSGGIYRLNVNPAAFILFMN